VLRAKIAGYKPAVTYPKDAFSQQLQLAAQIVGSNLGTRIVFVSIGSFDTHAGQRAQQDRLLGYLSQRPARVLQRSRRSRQRDDKVLAMTFSEFGRRVQRTPRTARTTAPRCRSSSSAARYKGGVYGEHPSLTDLDNGDLKFATDFRSVYATVLERWLGRDGGHRSGKLRYASRSCSRRGRQASLSGSADTAPVVVKLETRRAEEYVREVLPQTFPLWGGDRDFERYVADFRTFATSTYGKRRRSPWACARAAPSSVRARTVRSRVRWGELAARHGHRRRVHAAGICAAAVTRARCSARCSISERAAGRDLAFLYSDIHPAFYERFGFVTLPSRI
jgi:hypothetical protein